MGALSVPIIDISSLQNDKGRHNVLQQIGTACEEWGFFYIVNHGIDKDLVDKTVQLGKGFFHMPKEFKDKVARREVKT